MFVDAFDIIFQSNPQEILEKFNSFNASIVYSAEKNCWPFFADKWGDWITGRNRVDEIKKIEECVLQRGLLPKNYTYLSEPRGPLQVSYLNSGLMMGYVSSVVPWFAKSISIFDAPKLTDDQEIAARVLLTHEFNAVLDYDSVLFQNMWSANADLELRDGYWWNNVTESRPAVVHFNGDKGEYYGTEAQMWYNTVEMVDGPAAWGLEGGVMDYSQVCSKKGRCL